MDQSLKISADEAGSRLDAFLASRIEGWSRSRLRRLIDDADVLVNGQKAKPSYKLRETDEIEVELTELPVVSFEPEDIPLDIVYEDEVLAVINKPAGMVVHPGAGVTGGTLANALAFHFGLAISDLGLEGGDEQSKIQNLRSKIGIVHRLDKDTSGLIVVAKDEQTAEELSRQFHDREVEKSYVALVHGWIEDESGTIERPLARDKHNRTRMRIADHGRYALTLWRVRDRSEKFTLLSVDIKTGRTHQIRVHLASINHPVLGDETYNAGRDKTVADLTVRQAIADLGRFFLHAEKLAFTHPKTGDRMHFKQELPPELERFLQLL
ncbi:MAG TPA: RluA family pseudouridine synthase [Pyrinomonadaceae bacterium]|nr:RluA family pseudouridine synthase [Pyrinomonadaceae bacterium]